jgi:hypothetical protein
MLSIDPPAQRAGRLQPRAEAEGRCPGKKGTTHPLCGLKGRENPARYNAWAGKLSRPFRPQRFVILPSAQGVGLRPRALGSILPARWAEQSRNTRHLSKIDFWALPIGTPRSQPGRRRLLRCPLGVLTRIRNRRRIRLIHRMRDIHRPKQAVLMGTSTRIGILGAKRRMLI